MLMKKAVVYLLASILVVGLIGGPAIAGKKKKKKPPVPPAPVTQTITFEAEGTTKVPAVTNAAGGGVTEIEFTVANSCGSMPATQGHDGYVVELPEPYRDGNATITVAGSDATGLYDYNVYLYDSECNLMEPYIEEGADASGAIPAGAQWAMVDMVGGAQGAFKLTATNTITVLP
jgi:extracellular elastinolytic metalloproteinase